MYKETRRQGVQGVQDKCLLASYFHKQWKDTGESGNVLRSALPLGYAKNSLNSMSPCLQKASGACES